MDSAPLFPNVQSDYCLMQVEEAARSVDTVLWEVLVEVMADIFPREAVGGALSDIPVPGCWLVRSLAVYWQ